MNETLYEWLIEEMGGQLGSGKIYRLRVRKYSVVLKLVIENCHWSGYLYVFKISPN